MPRASYKVTLPDANKKEESDNLMNDFYKDIGEMICYKIGVTKNNNTHYGYTDGRIENPTDVNVEFLYFDCKKFGILLTKLKEIVGEEKMKEVLEGLCDDLVINGKFSYYHV